jgi:hypothetical protein
LTCVLLLPLFTVVDYISISVWCYISCCWNKGTLNYVKRALFQLRRVVVREDEEFRSGLLLCERGVVVVRFYEGVTKFFVEDGLFIIQMVAGCMFLVNVETFHCI